MIPVIMKKARNNLLLRSYLVHHEAHHHCQPGILAFEYSENCRNFLIRLFNCQNIVQWAIKVDDAHTQDRISYVIVAHKLPQLLVVMQVMHKKIFHELPDNLVDTCQPPTRRRAKVRSNSTK